MSENRICYKVFKGLENRRMLKNIYGNKIELPSNLIKLNWFRCTMLFLGLSLLISCTQPTPQPIKPDKSYLQGIPCVVPCWQNITPGKSTEEGIQTIISDPDLVDQSSIHKSDNSIASSETGYRFKRVSDGSASLGLYDGTVYRIQIRPGYNLNINEVFNAFGFPDLVYAKRKPNEHSVYDYYEVEFFYIEKGVWISGSECADECEDLSYTETGVMIRPNMLINRLTFFEPNPSLYETLVDSLLLDAEYAQELTENAVPWQGFDQYYPTAP